MCATGLISFVYLVDNQYTSGKKLAIKGASNGGLTVAAVVNQAPELFGAAITSNELFDMLKFHTHTIGRYWQSEYGNLRKKEDYVSLKSYSPYHNLSSTNPLPPFMLCVDAADDRVPAWHTYKYVAAPCAMPSPSPVVLRVERNTGHTSSKANWNIRDQQDAMREFAAGLSRQASEVQLQAAITRLSQINREALVLTGSSPFATQITDLQAIQQLASLTQALTGNDVVAVSQAFTALRGNHSTLASRALEGLDCDAIATALANNQANPVEVLQPLQAHLQQRQEAINSQLNTMRLEVVVQPFRQLFHENSFALPSQTDLQTLITTLESEVTAGNAQEGPWLEWARVQSVLVEIATAGNEQEANLLIQQLVTEARPGVGNTPPNPAFLALISLATCDATSEQLGIRGEFSFERKEGPSPKVAAITVDNFIRPTI